MFGSIFPYFSTREATRQALSASENQQAASFTMKNIFCFLAVVLGFSGWVQAQHLLKGSVRDAQTNEALPFVSILINEGPNGTTSDIDGKFQVKSKDPVQLLTFSYLGYEPQKRQLSDSAMLPLVVKLKPQATSLREVV